MKREASIEDGPLFNAEKRDKVRKLAGLGVLAHQPAIAAYCEVTEEEMENLTRCIMQQKIGSRSKVSEIVHEFPKKSQEAKCQPAPSLDPSNLLKVTNQGGLTPCDKMEEERIRSCHGDAIGKRRPPTNWEAVHFKDASVYRMRTEQGGQLDAIAKQPGLPRHPLPQHPMQET